MGGQAFTKLAFPFPRGGGRRPRTPSVRLHKIKRAQTSHAKAKRASKRRKPQPTRPLPGNAAAANNVHRRKSEIKALAQQQRRLPVGSGHRERRGRTRQTTIIEACVCVSTREGNRASLKKKRERKMKSPKGILQIKVCRGSVLNYTDVGRVQPPLFPTKRTVNNGGEQ